MLAGGLATGQHPKNFFFPSPGRESGGKSARISGFVKAVLTIKYLACRANMRSALSNHDTLDGGAAYRAGFALAAVYPEMVLEIAASVDPVDTGPIAEDAFLQHLPDCHPQDFGFFPGYCIRGRQWMESGHMQCFIRVDVTQSGQEGLVQQQRLELPVLAL